MERGRQPSSVTVAVRQHGSHRLPGGGTERLRAHWPEGFSATNVPNSHHRFLWLLSSLTHSMAGGGSVASAGLEHPFPCAPGRDAVTGGAACHLPLRGAQCISLSLWPTLRCREASVGRPAQCRCHLEKLAFCRTCFAKSVLETDSEVTDYTRPLSIEAASQPLEMDTFFSLCTASILLH